MWHTLKKSRTLLIAVLPLILILLAVSNPVRSTIASTVPQGDQVASVTAALCPGAPTALTTYGTALGIDVQGSYAYVGDMADPSGSGTSTLQIFDVSNPCAPQLAGKVNASTPSANELGDLVVRNTPSGLRAYLANDANGLAVYDVQNPASPAFLAGNSTNYSGGSGPYAYSIFYDGGIYAYVGRIYAPGSELAIYNMSAFPGTAPTFYAPTFAGNRDIYDVEVAGGQAYILAGDGAGNNHLQVLSLANPAQPALLGDLALPLSQYGSVGELRVQGSYVYLASGGHPTHNGGLVVISVATSTAPQVVGSAFIPDAAEVPFSGASLALSGSHAYVVTKKGLDTFTISSPASPTLLGPAPSFAFPATLGASLGGRVRISGSLAYVTSYRDTADPASKGGMVIYDLSADPALMPYRDVGNIRVWADTFAAVGAQTNASGTIGIGPAGAAAPTYSVGTTASWSGSGPLTLTGNLGFSGGQPFAIGIFSLNTASGAVSWGAGSHATLTKLGASNLAITPMISVNVLQPQVQVSATVALGLLENPGKTIPVSYSLGAGGAISGGQPTDITLTLAGGTLVATVTPTSTGLVAGSAQYTLPGLAAMAMPSLVIDGQLPIGLHFGSGGSFLMPNIDLGGGTLVLSGLQGSLMVSGSAYVINLSGGLSINGLPEMPQPINASVANLRIAQGAVAGDVGSLALKAGGYDLSLSGVSIQRATDYRLVAAGATWALPPFWGGGSVALPQAAITTAAPYLDLGGAFPIPDRILGKVLKLSGLSASLALNPNRTYTMNVAATVSFTAGKSLTSSGGITFTITGGTVSATLDRMGFQIAGLSVAVTQLDYLNGTFSAQAATLVLPVAWKAATATVSGLRITNDAVAFGPAGVIGYSFAIPDVTLGTAGALRLSSSQGALVLDTDGDYRIAIATQITISKVQSPNGASGLTIPGSLEINQRRIGGSVGAVAFKVGGVSIAADAMTFVNDKLVATQARLTLPIKGSEAGTIVYGLELGGGAGFRLQGTKVALPDFKIGTVAVRAVTLEFKTAPDGAYLVVGTAKFAFSMFMVDGTFQIGYLNTGEAALQPVVLNFLSTPSAPPIALGKTGLFINSISGTFSLSNGSASITLQLGAASNLLVGGRAALEFGGTVTIQIQPRFQINSGTGTVVKLIGLDVTRAQMHIDDATLSLSGQVQISVIKASLAITFGQDASGQFTLYGNVNVSVVVPKGHFSSGKWVLVPFPPFRIYLPPNPPVDIKVNAVSLQGGKMIKGKEIIWGARGTTSVLGIPIPVWAKFGPGDAAYGIGTNLNEYQAVKPDTSGSPKLLSDDDLLTANITSAAEYLIVTEWIDAANRAAPQSLMVAGPAGVAFTTQVAYEEADKSYRTYRIDLQNPAQAVGIWSFSPQAGNIITIFGADPPPHVSSFTACASVTTCINPSSTTALSNGQSLDLTWSASAAKPGLALDIYAEDANGLRQPIAHQETSDQQSLMGSAHWAVGLPSGSYTLTLQLDAEGFAPVKVEKGVITLSDSTPPAAPASLQAIADAALSATASWDGAQAEPDVAGYQVSVDGGEPITAQGRLAQYIAYGLKPGVSHTLSVAAYDLSGNLGPAATASVMAPQFGVGVAWPRLDSIATDVNEIGASFGGPISLGSLRVTDALGEPVAGSVTPLTGEASVTNVITLGATFTPTSGLLGPGSYTATITATDLASGGTLTYSWTFIATQSAPRVYLPLMHR